MSRRGRGRGRHLGGGRGRHTARRADVLAQSACLAEAAPAHGTDGFSAVPGAVVGETLRAGQHLPTAGLRAPPACKRTAPGQQCMAGTGTGTLGGGRRSCARDGRHMSDTLCHIEYTGRNVRRRHQRNKVRSRSLPASAILLFVCLFIGVLGRVYFAILWLQRKHVTVTTHRQMM